MVLLVLLAALGWAVATQHVRGPVPAGVAPPSSAVAVPAPPPTPATDGVEVVATGLEVPWALAFAPARNASPSDAGGPAETLYATERLGRLVRIEHGKPVTVATIPDVSQRQESGLLGLALDPEFAENQQLYLYYTSRRNTNRVVRYRLTEDGLGDEHVLLDNIPAAPFHDGGRIAFGPDGNLYITTGDAAQPELAQDHRSLAGKILRVRADGAPPPDNPWPDSPVYTLGHRNPQGLVWAADGALYATEHGPSQEPPDCCHDEINTIERRRNYGWPYYRGRELRTVIAGSGPGKAVEFMPPLAESGPTETWAPAGAAIIHRTLVFAGLRGKALYALDLDRPDRGVTKHFAGQFGRLRDVVRGPDGFLYVTTSNRDGRGNPGPDDDRILRVNPSALLAP